MSRATVRRVVAACTLAVAAAAFASPALAETTAFSGRAVAVDGKVAGIPITLADTGPVAAEGGDLETTLVCYPTGDECTVGLPDLTNGMLRAEALRAVVIAQGQTSSADATVADVALSNVAGNTISATLLHAEAQATCNGEFASVSGGAEIASLTINGQTIDVTGAPNQRIDLPGGAFVIVNEQIATVKMRRGEIDVAALHIVIPGVLGLGDTDFYVARAHADILCAHVARGCRGSRVTGGGWYQWLGSRVHFALGAMDGLSTWGHLNYMDKARGVKVRGNPVAATIVPAGKNDGEGAVEGTASGTANGSAVGYFVVAFFDGGEPGRSDKFAITLLTHRNGTVLYEANVSLALALEGGNLQVHACK